MAGVLRFLVLRGFEGLEAGPDRGVVAGLGVGHFECGLGFSEGGAGGFGFFAPGAEEGGAGPGHFEFETDPVGGLGLGGALLTAHEDGVVGGDPGLDRAEFGLAFGENGFGQGRGGLGVVGGFVRRW